MTLIQRPLAPPLPDPLLALTGTLQPDVTNIGERHDDYIADALLAGLWRNNHE